MVDQTHVRAPDVYARSFQMDPRTLDVMVTRLEAWGRHPFFLRAIDEYLNALALSGRPRVLDLGCGTGVAARALARRPDFAGSVVAIDISDYLTAAGRRLPPRKAWASRSISAPAMRTG